MIENTNNSSKPEQPETELASDAAGQSQKARRQFLKAGLIGVPMIVTLRSRPAMALNSLGSAAIFYGRYGRVEGTDEWVPINENNEALIDPTRREGGTDNRVIVETTP